ncbi:hypothetical protein B1218_38270, partial [Pseudomonas ogarae]
MREDEGGGGREGRAGDAGGGGGVGGAGRGGMGEGERGGDWGRGGKQEHRRDRLGDCVGCAEHWIANGFTTAGRVAISGGRGGGLLIGAVLDERPELFRVGSAEVPFVDVLNTMLGPD